MRYTPRTRPTPPNDWIYETCRDVCVAIDADDLPDPQEDEQGLFHEWVDSQVEIYTRKLYQWQADMCQTDVYADAESRLADMGMEGTNGEKRVSALQYCAIELIAQAIWEAVREHAEEEEDDDS